MLLHFTSRNRTAGLRHIPVYWESAAGGRSQVRFEDLRVGDFLPTAQSVPVSTFTLYAALLSTALHCTALFSVCRYSRLHYWHRCSSSTYFPPNLVPPYLPTPMMSSLILSLPGLLLFFHSRHIPRFSFHFLVLGMHTASRDSAMRSTRTTAETWTTRTYTSRTWLSRNTTTTTTRTTEENGTSRYTVSMCVCVCVYVLPHVQSAIFCAYERPSVPYIFFRPFLPIYWASIALSLSLSPSLSLCVSPRIRISDCIWKVRTD